MLFWITNLYSKCDLEGDGKEQNLRCPAMDFHLIPHTFQQN